MRGGENIKKAAEEKVGRGEKLEVSGKDGGVKIFTLHLTEIPLCAHAFS